MSCRNYLFVEVIAPTTFFYGVISSAAFFLSKLQIRYKGNCDICRRSPGRRTSVWLGRDCRAVPLGREQAGCGRERSHRRQEGGREQADSGRDRSRRRPESTGRRARGR
ncbi:unnamed protein product [Adineta ricciae]|uniref:Uncharacterized protein n=1 Tax=Adineta ricciae TaxID=249248 RepID=A0A816GUJ3_ADIRI|nr:unnamed protein product [Adineta ricciae]